MSRGEPALQAFIPFVGKALVARQYRIVGCDKQGDNGPIDLRRQKTQKMDICSQCSPMLGETEGVVVDLLAEPADEVADLVLDLGQLGLRLWSHLHQVHGRVDVA